MEEAILVVGFGGPRGPEEIRPFLADVLRGRPVPPERIEEVAHHYEVIGGRSPIVELTEAQVRGMTAALREMGIETPVRLAHRHSAPFVRDVLAEMAAAGVRRVVGLAMTAYEGEASSGRYEAAVARAREAIGASAPEVKWARGLRTQPGFLAAQVEVLSRVLGGIAEERRAEVPVLFTAHSVPVSAAGTYLVQLEETARAVAGGVGHARHRLCWQSRSGSPREPWLEPDVCDVIREEAARGVGEIVVAPIGFLCDHVEVLYDLDVEAAGAAREAGVVLHRAPTVNEHPAFIAALAETVRAAISP